MLWNSFHSGTTNSVSLLQKIRSKALYLFTEVTLWVGYVLIKKTVSIKTNGIKEHVKKQLLLGNLKELYANFNEENPNTRKVELSTFYKTKGVNNSLQNQRDGYHHKYLSCNSSQWSLSITRTLWHYLYVAYYWRMYVERMWWLSFNR